MRDRKGFTLIELLVVIAIIAILAAILFPVFHRARLKAHEATCAGRMKQISLALAMYHDDYDGEGISALAYAWTPEGVAYGNYWYQKLGPYDAHFWVAGPTAENLFNSKLWTCQSGARKGTYNMPYKRGAGATSWRPAGQKFPVQTMLFGESPFLSYQGVDVTENWPSADLTFNSFVWHFIDPKAHWELLPRITAPDWYNDGDINPGHAGHNGRNLICYQDGHVKSMTQMEQYAAPQIWYWGRQG